MLDQAHLSSSSNLEITSLETQLLRLAPLRIYENLHWESSIMNSCSSKKKIEFIKIKSLRKKNEVFKTKKMCSPQWVFWVRKVPVDPMVRKVYCIVNGAFDAQSLASLRGFNPPQMGSATESLFLVVNQAIW